MKRLLPAFLIGIAVLGWNHLSSNSGSHPDRSSADLAVKLDQNWKGGQQVQSFGEVIRVLPDDNDGSRHQRFIIQLASGRTLLIAHNIDLAPRIPSLRVGDTVHFNGEYEWNEKGGVIHWTHHDPRNRHEAGWIEHRGKKYQ